MPNRGLRDTLIILAALAVLLWGAVLASYCGDAPQVAAATDAAPSEHSEYWSVLGRRLKITDTFVALFTAALAAFTYQLVRAGHRQEAHNVVTERAYVKLSHHPPGLHVEDVSGLCWVSMQVKNFGHTPARITDVSLGVKVLPNNEALPGKPIYEKTLIDEVYKVFLVTDDHASYFPIPFNIGEHRVSDLKIGSIKLWLIGYVDYVDMFGQRYRAGYARVYRSGVDMRELYGPGPDGDAAFANRSNLSFVTEEGYNYDRERVPSEGNDW